MDLIQAAFPGGSITGAPKIRAMEIIDELEIPLNLQNKDVGYLNIGFDVWKREFKNRIQELNWKDKLEIIEKNIKLLKKHLSEDDLFEIDMNNFELVDF